jgi:hypothetical protein
VHASVRAAIAVIPEDAWTPVRYPRAIWDDQLGCWVSDAVVAEIQYTSKKEKLQAISHFQELGHHAHRLPVTPQYS